MSVKKVRRWVPKNNIKHLPQLKSHIVKYGGEGIRRGRVLCEIDFHWVCKNGKKYERLIGRQA